MMAVRAARRRASVHWRPQSLELRSTRERRSSAITTAQARSRVHGRCALRADRIVVLKSISVRVLMLLTGSFFLRLRAAAGKLLPVSAQCNRFPHNFSDFPSNAFIGADPCGNRLCAAAAPDPPDTLPSGADGSGAILGGFLQA